MNQHVAFDESLQASDGPGIAALLRAQGSDHAGATAVYRRRHGLWRTLDWGQQLALIDDFARGFQLWGVAPGEVIGVAGLATPRLSLAIVALQSVGAVPALLRPDLDRDALVQVAGRHRIGRFVLGTRGDRALAEGLAGDIAQYIDVGAVDGEEAPGIDLLARQAAGRALLPPVVRPAAALLTFEIDNEGRPLSRAVTHEALAAAAQGLAHRLCLSHRDRVAVLLPVGVGPGLDTFLAAALAGSALVEGETPASLDDDLPAAGPTVVVAPPAWVRRLRHRVDARVAETGGLRRRLLNKALDEKRKGGWARRLAGPGLRERFGLGQLRRLLIAGPVLPPGLAAFLGRIGLDGALVVADAGEQAGTAEILAGSRLIRHALILRDASGTSLALVSPDAEGLARALPGVDDPLADPRAAALIGAEIAGRTAGVTAGEAVSRFALALPPFSLAAGAVTIDGRVIRARAIDAHAATVARLYDGGGQPVPVLAGARQDAPPLDPDPQLLGVLKA